MGPSTLDIVASVCFGLAIIHTFVAGRILKYSHRFPKASWQGRGLHVLGELEVVFGIWAAVFFAAYCLIVNPPEAIRFIEERNFTEPLFVFAILLVCSTRPVLSAARSLIGVVSALIPIKEPIAFYFTALTLGPLLGSFITEPASMTVVALLLLERFYKARISTRLKYATLGLLFVNVSIGGTLTPYAAPPILIVAGQWNWDLAFMLENFGWKGALAVLVSTTIVTLIHRRELGAVRTSNPDESRIPSWIIIAHLAFLVGVVLAAHHPILVLAIVAFFLGLYYFTQAQQSRLQVKESFLVAFFLAGLVVLGAPQRWWLEPIISSLDSLPLYLGAMSLTAITDNAALTYLASQVPSLAEGARYYVVAGAVVGGGLTVIANAPNPAGYAILGDSFGESGILPLKLLQHAIPPTFIAAICFWFL